MKIPVVGDKIYVSSSIYVYRGADDFSGGIATVSKVELNPGNKTNYCFVSIKERPGSTYNWAHLEKEQKKLKKLYGDEIAHPDPDLRPEFNDSEADWR